MFFSILLLSRRSKFWYATKYMSWEYTVWILALSLYWSQSCARFSAFISAVFEEIFSIINNILCFFQFYFWVGGLNFGMQLNICLENIQCEFLPLVSIGHRVVPVLVRSFLLFLKKYSVLSIIFCVFFNFTFE